MSFINLSANSINFSLVYAGAVGAGKTTTLRGLYDWANPERRSTLTTFETKPSSTTYFHYRFERKIDRVIPAGLLRNFTIEAKIAALPPPGYVDSARLLLHGVDGIVFVADSQKDRSEDNLAAWANLQSLLDSMGMFPADVPTVIQFNKRDLPAKSVMKRSAPSFLVGDRDPFYFGTVATQGIGLLKPLSHLLKIAVKAVMGS